MGKKLVTAAHVTHAVPISQRKPQKKLAGSNIVASSVDNLKVADQGGSDFLGFPWFFTGLRIQRPEFGTELIEKTVVGKHLIGENGSAGFTGFR